jgi:MFS family permease
MLLIDPDIVQEAQGISVGLSAAGVGIGLLLWLTGWWAHRFWIVLGATVAAGVLGLLKGPGQQTQPLVVGLLLAVAAGALALSLVRVLAFAAGGAAAWMALRGVVPPPWNEPLLCFLAGGLVGLLLFRVWTMVLTSLAGSVLMGYSGLCLADRLGKLDAVAWSGERGPMLTWACGGAALMGVLVQFVLDRRRVQEERRRLEEDRELYKLKRQMPRGWWWNRGARYTKRAV